MFPFYFSLKMDTPILILLLLALSSSHLESSLGLRFSSKLMHRLSDEAKTVWRSRNGNVTTESLWLKKNSVEYYDFLLGNDLKRQRMKLVGSQSKDLLFPSQGSRTLSFGNELAWLHYTWIDVGTPNRSFLVALDAGSDLFWVPCDCIQCAPLSASSYNSLDRDLSEYRPSLSSTSRRLPCGHELCEAKLNCKSMNEPCPYIVDYADGNTSTSGFLVEDKLHLASFNETAATKNVQVSVIIGCGRKQTGSYLEGAAPDGVMGLGPGNISIPSLLAKAGLIQNSFSLCFDENDSGMILFGDKGHASQQSTSFLPVGQNYDAYFVRVESFCVGNSCLEQSGFKALVDSGSSFTFLPTEVYNKVVSDFDKQVNAERISSQDAPWKYCYDIRSSDLHHVPDIRLLLQTNQSFVVKNPLYSVPQDEEYTLFCLNVQPTENNYGIIGQNFMIGYRMVFDMESLRLRWSKSDCQDTSNDTEVNLVPPSSGGSTDQLPTNEQQSIPNSHAVAPALAGKTTSEHSSASRHAPSLVYETILLYLLLIMHLHFPSI